MSRNVVRLVLAFAVAAVAAACGGNDAQNGSEAGANAGAGAAAPAGGYPAPRWPSYFQPPKSIDDLMPAARQLVRNTSGFQGKGMGILQAGESVLIVPTASADPMVVEAIVKALEERKITPHVKYSHEFEGRTAEDVKREQDASRKGRDIENAGIYQATSWIEG